MPEVYISDDMQTVANGMAMGSVHEELGFPTPLIASPVNPGPEIPEGALASIYAEIEKGQLVAALRKHGFHPVLKITPGSEHAQIAAFLRNEEAPIRMSFVAMPIVCMLEDHLQVNPNATINDVSQLLDAVISECNWGKNHLNELIAMDAGASDMAPAKKVLYFVMEELKAKLGDKFKEKDAEDTLFGLAEWARGIKTRLSQYVGQTDVV